MKSRLLFLLAFVLPIFVLLLLYQPAPAAVGPEDADVWIVKIYYDDQAELQALANWREPWEVNEAEGYLLVDIRPVDYDILAAAGFTVTIQQEMTTEANRPLEPLPGQGTDTIPGFPCYRTVESTLNTGSMLASNHPELATWTDIGDSWEKVQANSEGAQLANPIGLGYDIMVLKLTNNNTVGPKPKLVILGGLHAREFTTAELATRFAEHLVANYGVDADVTWLLDHHEIHLVLQVNPDGRKLAEGPSLHRKNTNDDNCSVLVNPGIDLNRNFPYLWGYDSGSSNEGCTDTYRGTAAASEPETMAVVDYVRSQIPDQRNDDLLASAPITTTGAFLDLHAYGNVILWPWGPPADDLGVSEPPNQEDFNAFARRMGFINNFAASKSLSYSVSGTTKDFAYGELGIPGFTVELGTTFHQSCSYFENILLPDNIEMLTYAAKASAMPYALPFGPDSVNLAFEGPTIIGQNPILTATVDDNRYGNGGGNNMSGQVPSQNVVEANYYIDTPPWENGAVAYPLDAADGSFDSSTEVVWATIDTSSLTPGPHIIYIQAADSDGDQGVVGAIYLNLVDGEFNHLPIVTNP